MAWYPARGGGIPASVKTDMNAVLNKKFGTVGETYPPKEWADDVNLMGLLPIRTASGAVASFSDGADDVPCVSVVANIVPIQEGTGDPSPSNPRPISGTSVLNITQQGANLFNYSTLQTGYRVVWGTGADYADASASKSDYILVKEGARIRFSDSVYVLGYDTEKTYLGAYIDSAQSWLKQSGSLVDDVTIPKGTAYIKIMDFGSISGTITSAFVVNYGETKSTDTTYHTAETYTFDLGQEIMGGTADFVGGVGSGTMAEIDLGDLTWTYRSTQNCFSANINEMPLNTVLYCDIYGYSNVQYVEQLPNGNIWNRTNAFGAHNIAIKDTRFDNATDFKNAVTGYKLAYEVTTPTDFTFTGQPINSYLGVNNLYTDSGEVLDVDYRADMNLLIASLEGNRGLQMTRAIPTEENDEQEATENEGER